MSQSPETVQYDYWPHSSNWKLEKSEDDNLVCYDLTTRVRLPLFTITLHESLNDAARARVMSMVQDAPALRRGARDYLRHLVQVPSEGENLEKIGELFNLIAPGSDWRFLDSDWDDDEDGLNDAIYASVAPFACGSHKCPLCQSENRDRFGDWVQMDKHLQEEHKIDNEKRRNRLLAKAKKAFDLDVKKRTTPAAPPEMRYGSAAVIPR